MKPPVKKLIRIPLIISGLIGLALVLVAYVLNYSGYVWDNYPVEQDIDVFFCEYSRMDNLVREPVNTLTNIPYLFVGIMLWILANKDRRKKKTTNLMVRYPIYTRIYAMSCIFLFFASTFFHASLIRVAQQLDMGAVFAIVLLPIFYNLHKINNYYYNKTTKETSIRLIRRFLIAFGIMVTILTLLKWHMNSAVVIPSLVALITLTAIFLEFRVSNYTNKRYLLISVTAIAMGMTLYAGDKYKTLCDYNLWIPPHALWHIFAAASILTLYLYLRSEDNEDMMEWRLAK